MDREPQPFDGPDYHADWASWAERQRSRGVRVCVQSCDYPIGNHSFNCQLANQDVGSTIHQRKRRLQVSDSYTGDGRFSSSEPMGSKYSADTEKDRNPHLPTELVVEVIATSETLAELERNFRIHSIRVNNG